MGKKHTAKSDAPPPAYDGDWTLIAERTHGYGTPNETTVDGIKSFNLVDGTWFVSGPTFVTAIPLDRWDQITLTKNDTDGD